MDGRRSNRTAQFVFAIAFGILGASAVWYWGVPGPNVLEQNPADKDEDDSKVSTENGLVWNPVAQSYVRALLEGRCVDVIAMTNWMQERLEYVRRTETNPKAEDEARRELCERLSDRRPEENQLTPEGIEDHYLFAPGVEYELFGVDGGRDDLAKPVRARNWIRLRYPNGYRAPKDREGIPIRTVVVGINVSTEDMILKAGVRGTAEIDWDTITTGWTKDRGE